MEEQNNVNIQGIIAQIDDIVKDQAVDAVNVLVIALNAMQLVESLPNLKGQQKKDIVLQVMRAVLERHGGHNELMGLIPSFIDTTISVDRGDVVIKIKPQEVVSCCLGLFQK